MSKELPNCCKASPYMTCAPAFATANPNIHMTTSTASSCWDAAGAFMISFSYLSQVNAPRSIGAAWLMKGSKQTRTAKTAAIFMKSPRILELRPLGLGARPLGEAATHRGDLVAVGIADVSRVEIRPIVESQPRSAFGHATAGERSRMEIV